MKKHWKTILAAAVSFVFAAVIAVFVWGSTWRMMSANRDFQAGKLDAAGAVYQEMGVDQPKSPYILHNRSLIAYETARTGSAASTQYNAANQLISKAIQETARMKNITSADRQKLYYQAGNTAFQTAAAMETAPPPNGGNGAGAMGNSVVMAGNLYQQALQHYKKAIEIDPADLAAKYNYELTQLRRKHNQEKQQQQSENGGNSNQPKNRQNSSGPDGQKKPDNSGGQNPPGSRKGSQNNGNQPRPGGPMTKEQAEALLKMAENGDQYQAPQVPGLAGTPEKDW